MSMSRFGRSGVDSVREKTGLIAWLEETRVQLPLRGVECRFGVSGGVGEVWIDQIFEQSNKQALECVYQFPLPADAAVYRCQMEVNGRLITARVEEREKARLQAAEQAAAGRRTVLAEMEEDNLFTLGLGNVQPGDCVVVHLRYFQPLRRLGKQQTVEIPFCPGIRYVPGKPLLRTNAGFGISDDTDHAPNASRLSPPRIDTLHPDAAYLLIEGRLSADGVAAGSVSSPTHPIVVQEKDASLDIRIADGDTLPDRDFVVRWLEPEVAATRTSGWVCGREAVTYALLELRAPETAGPPQAPRDLYFLLDRSGSMQGSKWEKAVLALQTSIGALANSDRAMVTLFESSWQDFAEKPLGKEQLLGDGAFQELVRLGTAGGTELGPALEHVLGMVRTHSKRRTAVIVLITDAQVANEDEILEIANREPNVVFHCFGLDTALNDSLLLKLARQSGGTCHSLKPDDDIVGAVTSVAGMLRGPVLTDLTVSQGWEPAEPKLASLFAGQVRYVAVRSKQHDSEITLSGRTADGNEWTGVVSLAKAVGQAPFLVWHKQRLTMLLGEARDVEAIALSIYANLVCRLTAFVAWDETERVAVATRQLVQPSFMVGGALSAACYVGASPEGFFAQAALDRPPRKSLLKRMRSMMTGPAAPRQQINQDDIETASWQRGVAELQHVLVDFKEIEAARQLSELLQRLLSETDLRSAGRRATLSPKLPAWLTTLKAHQVDLDKCQRALASLASVMHVEFQLMQEHVHRLGTKLSSGTEIAEANQVCRQFTAFQTRIQEAMANYADKVTRLTQSLDAILQEVWQLCPEVT